MSSKFFLVIYQVVSFCFTFFLSPSPSPFLSFFSVTPKEWSYCKRSFECEEGVGGRVGERGIEREMGWTKRRRNLKRARKRR